MKRTSPATRKIEGYERTARFGDAVHPAGDENKIFGRNPVREAFLSGRTVDRLFVQDGATGSVGKILSLARESGTQIRYCSKADLDRLAGSGSHQGVLAFVAAYAYAEMEDVYRKAREMEEEPLLVILDKVEDPHNLGAILRTAECAGASGVVIAARGGASLNATVAKTSAGAVEYMPVLRVTNIARFIEELKEKDFWIAGLDMDGVPYTGAALTGKLALVVGSEGKGISRLVKEKCDFILSLPMRGKVNSLNASNAAAVALYEVRRQRDTSKK